MEKRENGERKHFIHLLSSLFAFRPFPSCLHLLHRLQRLNAQQFQPFLNVACGEITQ